MNDDPSADPADSFVVLLNGKLLPYQQAAIPIWDYGFTLGITLTERIRTYCGEPKLLARHLDRLFRSAASIGIDQPLDRTNLRDQILDVVARNRKLIDSRSDLGIGVCVTPGPMASALPLKPTGNLAVPGQPTVLIYAAELDFAALHDGFENGARLTFVETREVPASSIPKHIKHRNRLHYYLAEQEANAKQPGSRALLLDQEGMVAEATTGGVVLVLGNQLIAPPDSDVLPSISFEFAKPYFESAGLQLVRRPIKPSEVFQADEILWFSTSTLVQSVTEVDGQPIGTGRPGPCFDKLLAVLSTALDFDIAGQARERWVRNRLGRL